MQCSLLFDSESPLNFLIMWENRMLNKCGICRKKYLNEFLVNVKISSFTCL